jgi:hypothetical protein
VADGGLAGEVWRHFITRLSTNWWGSAAHQRGMRQYGLLCTRIFDQPKACYLHLRMAVTPDAKRFSQAMKHQFPSFRSYFHPSVQIWSTFQLIYQQALTYIHILILEIFTNPPKIVIVVLKV